MTTKTCILKQKHNAGWSFINSFFKSQTGGGLAGLVFMLTSLAVIIIILSVIADYSIYSYKKRIISKALDYSVSAAIQEVDAERSKDGLASGFTEASGSIGIENMYINEEIADNSFFETLEKNCGIQREDIEDSVLITIVNTSGGAIEYIVKMGSDSVEGTIDNPEELESVINSGINEFWDTSDPDVDTHTIFVTGNPRVNQFGIKPYYMAVIKDYQINGLFNSRKATFVAFKGSNIER